MSDRATIIAHALAGDQWRDLYWNNADFHAKIDTVAAILGPLVDSFGEQHRSQWRERRVAAGVKLRELATIIGIPPRDLADIEWGRTSPPPNWDARLNDALVYLVSCQTVTIPITTTGIVPPVA